MKLLKFIKKQKSKTINSINTLKQNPLDSLGQIIPVLLTLTSFIGLITAYIIFIVKGGYSHQVELLKTNGINGLEEAFTFGTVSLIVKGVVPIIIGMLSLCEFIVVLIKLFTAEHKILKIFAVIFLAISSTATISILILLIMYKNEIAIDFISWKTTHIIILTAVISSSALLILLLFSQTRWMIGYTALSLLISFIISPLILLLLENIILIVISAVLVLIISGVIKFIISFTGDASYNTSQPQREKPVIKT